MRCHFCGGTVPTAEKLFRSSLCPKCGKEVRICLHCTFYQPGAHWDCRETIPEPVTDKERANFCDYFRPKEDGPEKGKASTGEQDAKNKFNKLFGN